jgi:hypothetical protein
MARDGSGVYSTPPGTHGTPNTTILSAAYNANVDDVATDLNTPRPIVAGGTGATTPAAALTALGAVAKAGDTMTGHLTLPVTPAAANAVRKDYVDAATALNVAKTGDTMTGPLSVSSALYVKQTSGPASLWFQDNVGGNRMELYWEPTDNGIRLVNQSFPGTSLQLDSGGVVWAGNAFKVKNGFSGGYGSNNFNISWSPAHLWIDSTDLGAITISSDYRTKKDVTDLPGMWETVKALRPISYTQADFDPPSALKTATKDYQPLFVADNIERWGFLAHELQEATVDSAASCPKDDPAAIQAPNPFTVLAALTKALQEAMARIEALEAA